MEKKEKFTVLVTGFGPFDKHVVNASWEAVKQLNKLFSASNEMRDIKMVVKEIPVSYDNVDAFIPMIWEEHRPIVTLHVGVSHKADCLKLERYACNVGYKRIDIYNKCPQDNEAECKTLQTAVDVTKICDYVNENSRESNCSACVSDDAGRYLCEYIYCKSLEIAPDKTLFVHVPDLNKYSSMQTAKGLYDIIRYLIRNVKKNK